MTKDEVKLLQSFTNLEINISRLDWSNVSVGIRAALSDFKTKFYEILLEKEEPE